MKKMTPEEYRAALKLVRASQPIVSAAEARRQYLEIQAAAPRTKLESPYPE